MPRLHLDKRALVDRAERSEEHTSELQSRLHLVCRLLLEKKKKTTTHTKHPHTPQAQAARNRPGPPSTSQDLLLRLHRSCCSTQVFPDARSSQIALSA